MVKNKEILDSFGLHESKNLQAESKDLGLTH
jgi:hypothetical protein